MTITWGLCPILRQQKVGRFESGIYWTKDGEVKVDNQQVINVCLDCSKNPCWHECKGKEREREFSNEHR